jgi:hypothetical protein
VRPSPALLQFVGKAIDGKVQFKKMILKGSDITNSQAMALAQTLRKYPFVSQLDLSKNLINDEGATALLKTLRFQLLNAYNCKDCPSCKSIADFPDLIALSADCKKCGRRVGEEIQFQFQLSHKQKSDSNIYID